MQSTQTSPALSTVGLKQKYIVLFTIDDTSGALESILRIFKDCDISLSHIESRPSKNSQWEYDFMTEFFLSDMAKVEQLEKKLSPATNQLTIVSPSPTVHNANGKL